MSKRRISAVSDAGSQAAISARAGRTLPFLLLGLLVGCRTAPIQDVVDAPLPLRCSEATTDDVDEAIWRAGRKLDWKIDRIGPGDLRGSLRFKRHVAVVSLTHHDGYLSIHYLESQNLRQDGGEIHRNYNVLVQRLLTQIQQEPVTLESGSLCPPITPRTSATPG
ncbi:MAG TPA: hypothetical protein VII72_17760 [Myxococcota bacterium]